MEINFKGPVMPVDPYSQMAFVEILNILLTARHIVDVNRFLILHAVATYGIQFPCLLQPAHIQHPFRDTGKPQQGTE